MENQKIVAVGNYRLVKTIGRGQFGKVKLAVHQLTGESVALKIIKKSELDKTTIKMVTREVMIMKLLNHPNIVKLFEVMENEEYLILVMEYASGGEVIDFIIAHGRLRENIARQFFRQVISAIDYCHSLRVIHRDIKPENLLLNDGFRIKIIDFGLSNCYVPGEYLKTFCGSPTYTAPELIQQKPYTGSSNLECADLIQRMLTVDPRQRATMTEIFRHPWVVGNGPQLVPHAMVMTGTGFRTEDLDQDVLDQLESIGMERSEVIDSVLHSTYDDSAAAYFLLVSKKQKEEENSANDRSPETRRERPEDRKKGSAHHRRSRTDGEGRGVVKRDSAPLRVRREGRIVTEELTRKREHPENSTEQPTQSDSEQSSAQQQQQQQQPNPKGLTQKSQQQQQQQPQQLLEPRNSTPPRVHGHRPVSPNRVSIRSTQSQGRPRDDHKQHPQQHQQSEDIVPPKLSFSLHTEQDSEAPAREPKRKTSLDGQQLLTPVDDKPTARQAKQLEQRNVASSAQRRGHRRHKSVDNTANQVIEEMIIPFDISVQLRARKRKISTEGNKSLENSFQKTFGKSNSSSPQITRSDRSEGSPSQELQSDLQKEKEGKDLQIPESPAPSTASTPLPNSITPTTSTLIPDTTQPREVRIPVDSNTIIHGSPDEVLQQIKLLLETHAMYFEVSGPYCLICKKELGSVIPTSTTEVTTATGTDADKHLNFELEICTIPNLDIYGLRFSRISGDLWEYERICKKILKKLFMDYL